MRSIPRPPNGYGRIRRRSHAARASTTATDGHALHSPLQARSHAIEDAYCPSPDERKPTSSYVPTGELQPHNRGTARSMAPLWCVRGEYRRACPPRRELQPAQRAHHPEPLPRIRAAAQPQPGAPKRHPGRLDFESVRRRIHTRLGPSRRAVRGSMSKRDWFFDKLERRATKKRCRRRRRKFTPPTGYSSLICPPCRRTESAG